jgi:transcriptional regulator with XRE-family HTH domain
MIQGMDEQEQALQLGATLAGLRRSLGLTQIELAEKAGVAPSTYLRHERGRKAPSEKLLERYIRELGFTMTEFTDLHHALQRARERNRMGPAWWRNPRPDAVEIDRVDELAKERFEQLGQLQADIYKLLFQRQRH